jgi:hypothetical protein
MSHERKSSSDIAKVQLKWAQTLAMAGFPRLPLGMAVNACVSLADRLSCVVT